MNVPRGNRIPSAMSPSCSTSLSMRSSRRRRLSSARQYKTSHPLPPTPERFADVRALANYASAQVRHEQTLDQLDKGQREAEQRLRTVEGKVAALLPLGSTVVHAYGGVNPGEYGVLCEITHDQASNHNSRMPVDVPYIRVRWFSGQPGL